MIVTIQYILGHDYHTSSYAAQKNLSNNLLCMLTRSRILEGELGFFIVIALNHQSIIIYLLILYANKYEYFFVIHFN